MFAAMKVPALHGRWFTREEDHPNGPPVIMLGYNLWQRRFGGDAAIVGDDTVEGQLQRVGDPQAAADEDERDQPVGRVLLAGEVARLLDLGHHVPGQGPGQQFNAAGLVTGEEHRVRRQGRCPAVLADRGEEQADHADVDTVLPSACHGCLQVGEVVLKDGPVDVAGPGDAASVQERGEPG